MRKSNNGNKDICSNSSIDSENVAASEDGSPSPCRFELFRAHGGIGWWFRAIAPAQLHGARTIPWREDHTGAGAIALAPTTTSLQASPPSKIKDKAKAIMIEPEVPLKRKDQVALDEEMARNLEAQLQAELIEEEKMARKKGRRSQHSFD
ncbi:hypothetical protein Tco_0311659 [Tanacetum coccineum]